MMLATSETKDEIQTIITMLTEATQGLAFPFGTARSHLVTAVLQAAAWFYTYRMDADTTHRGLEGLLLKIEHVKDEKDPAKVDIKALMKEIGPFSGILKDEQKEWYVQTLKTAEVKAAHSTPAKIKRQKTQVATADTGPRLYD